LCVKTFPACKTGWLAVLVLISVRIHDDGS
jgi:hypothetical protein